MWGLIGVITVLSATNDIAVDAYTIEILDRDEMGLANGIRIGFYRVGMLAAGAVLILPDWIGWPSAFGCAAALLGANAIAMLCAPREPARERLAPASLRGTLSGTFKHPLLAAGLACFGLFAVTLVAESTVITPMTPHIQGPKPAAAANASSAAPMPRSAHAIHKR
jgi:PAT family beta-lactamase induction signal transducer AmpG